MRSISERLLDIQEAIVNIEKYTHEGRNVLEENELIRGWVVLQLEIVGEVVRYLPQDFKNKHPHIPWKQISGMRDKLVHQYFAIDNDILWGVVKQDLPPLKLVVDEELRVLGNEA